ncbi:putative G-protein coupled receptor 139 [Tubulanus polymorphus]|uniref:putative G-protein coupled receptor 139 n=1 Tax=Tubulanus polymorphus TaxID=672921 RepID=UPI003DA1F138
MKPANRRIVFSGLLIVFGFGLVGNLASIFVMTSRRFRRLSYATYLTVLALTDLGSSIGLALMPAVQYSTESLVTSCIKSLPICIIYEYFFLVCSHSSSWFVVVVAVERLVVVLWPFSARQVCSPAIARKISCIVILLNCLLVSPFQGVVHMRYTRQNGCHYSGGSRYQNIIFTYAVTYVFIVPMLLTTVANVIIVVSLNRQPEFDATGGASSNKTSIARNRQTTVMLVTVTAVFIVATLPTTLSIYVSMPIEDMERLLAGISLLHSCNYVVNFYIYLLLGKEVRTTVIQSVKYCVVRSSKG